jgi:hypothetical protein
MLAIQKIQHGLSSFDLSRRRGVGDDAGERSIACGGCTWSVVADPSRAANTRRSASASIVAESCMNCLKKPIYQWYTMRI